MAYTVKQLVKAIEGSGGLIIPACKALGCHRSTFYSALDNQHPRYDKLRAAFKAARLDIVDIAEDSVKNLAEEGNLGACCFILKCLGKDRGWIERTEVGGIIFNLTMEDIEGLTNEENEAKCEELRRFLRGREGPPGGAGVGS